MSSEELIRESRRHPKIDDRGMMDVPFLVLVLLLVAIGLLMMFSASYVRANYETGNSLHFFIRQAGFAAVGLAAMFGASRFSCHIWQKLAKVIYAVSVLLLVAVLVVGVEAGGAKRWINLAGQQFQPSEVAKFSLICMMAAMAAQYKEKMADFRYGVVRMGGVMLLILALVALEKHLSAIMIIGIVSVVMMYVGGTKKRWLFLAMGLAVVFLVLYVSVMGYAGDINGIYKQVSRRPPGLGMGGLLLSERKGWQDYKQNKSVPRCSGPEGAKRRTLSADSGRNRAYSCSRYRTRMVAACARVVVPRGLRVVSEMPWIKPSATAQAMGIWA